MAKKENHNKNFSGCKAWVDRKKAQGRTPVRITAQRDYRITALRQRQDEGRMTDTNRAELSRLESEIAR